MINVQSWTLAAVAIVALLVGVLMATGAVSFAQTGSPTPAPAGTATPKATTATTPTPAPNNSSGGSQATPTPSPAPKSGTRQGCPDKQQGTTSTTSASNPQA